MAFSKDVLHRPPLTLKQRVQEPPQPRYRGLFTNPMRTAKTWSSTPCSQEPFAIRWAAYPIHGLLPVTDRQGHNVL